VAVDGNRVRDAALARGELGHRLGGEQVIQEAPIADSPTWKGLVNILQGLTPSWDLETLREREVGGLPSATRAHH
jgi:hypothetical protein